MLHPGYGFASERPQLAARGAAARGYDVRPVIEGLCDTGSVLELRAGTGVRTALARIGGRAVGVAGQ
jgi:acetyl-CoA carboxylase carboxyltransferase component